LLNLFTFVDAFESILKEEPNGVIFLPFFGDAVMDFSIKCNRRSIHFVLINSNLETKGMFVGDDVECFNYAD